MKNKFLYTVTLFLLFLSGCEKEKETETILNIIQTDLDVGEKGGKGFIFVETNAALTAESNADWCVASVQGKVVNVTVAANNALVSRTATVTISAGNRNEKVPVTQEGRKQPSRILTYGELAGDYTLTAKLGGDFWYGMTTFTSTLHLEPLEEGLAYTATIDNYLPDEAFDGFYGGQYEQYPFVVVYYEGSLIILNDQFIAVDSYTDEETGDYYEWEVYYLAVSSEGEIYWDENLIYVGLWNESLTQPVFNFISGSPYPDFRVIGFTPLWYNVIPEEEDLHGIDIDLFLYDWVLTKKEPIQ